ncbi:phage major capsid protein [Aeromonas hydrophila]|uniref:phage major capsid protein n=1 Tax=Aeromonas hydrophila TaxID=644 RepID=UPI002ED5B773|nr:phage major capsid protein [Aeromonas hydrophila]
MKIRFGKKEIEIADGVEMEQVLAAVAEEVQAVQDALEESKSKGSKSEDEVIRLQEELKAIKEQLEEVQEKALDEGMTEEEQAKAVATAQKSMNRAIRAAIKSGAKNIELFKNGQQVAGRVSTKSADGVEGAIVPQFHEEIVKRLREVSPTIADFKQLPVANEEFQLPVRAGKSGAALGKGYGAGAPDLKWNRGSFMRGSAKPVVSNDLINDAFFDVVAFIKESLAEDFSDLLADNLLNGTVAALGADSCDGLMSKFDKVEGKKDQKDRKTDYFAIVEGVATDEALIDELLAVTEKLVTGYRNSAKWYMSSAQFLKLNAMKDKMGHSYIKPSATDATVYQLHGKDIVVDSFIKSDAPIMYGDMRRAAVQLNLGNSFESMINEFQVDGAVTVPSAIRHGFVVGDNASVIGFYPAAA